MSTAEISPAEHAQIHASGSVKSRNIVLWTTGVLLALVLLLALLGPAIAPYDPNAVDPLSIGASPSSSHLLGADDVGRDLLSRTIVGSRSSLSTPLLVVLIATLIAAPIALVSAWLGGFVDGLLSRTVDVLFAVPGILLAIVAVAVFGTARIVPAVALAIAYTPYIARVTRGAALRERRLFYVQALEAQGLSGPRICLTHVLPNLYRIIASQAIILFGYAIADLAALSFLGLGVQPPTADWGLMVSDGQNALLAGRPEEMLAAGLAIVIVILLVNLFAEELLARGENR